MADPDLTKNPSPPQEEEKADVLDLTSEPVNFQQVAAGGGGGQASGLETKPYNSEETRENTRGDLARGLLWLLALVVGGVLVFIGLGRLEGTVLTQSIFPSLVALAGTALGFYFGSQKGSDSTGAGTNGSTASTANVPSGSPDGAVQKKN